MRAMFLRISPNSYNEDIAVQQEFENGLWLSKKLQKGFRRPLESENSPKLIPNNLLKSKKLF